MESLAVGIAVRVVDESAEFVPDIFAFDDNAVTYPEVLDAWGEVDVVNDEQGLSGGKSEDEALVAYANGVIAEQSGDATLAANGEFAATGAEGAGEYSIALAFVGSMGRGGAGRRWRGCIRMWNGQRNTECEKGAKLFYKRHVVKWIQ